MNRYPRERGRLAAAPNDTSRRSPVGRSLCLGVAFSALAIAVTLGCRPGASARAESPGALPSPGAVDANEPAPGFLRANVPSFKLTLNSLDGIEQIRGHDGRAEVPPGAYTVMRWSAESKDAAGRRWEARGGLMPKPIEVRSGQETRIRLADPIRVVMRGFFALNPMSFRLEYAGTEGELFEGVFVDGQTATPPRLHVRDATGKLVANQQFKAGCKGTCLLSWKTPPGLKGRFTATAVPSYGPFRASLIAPLRFTLNGKQATVVPPRVGEVATDFRLNSTNEAIYQLSLLRGQPVVLAFFCRCGLCHAVAKEITANPTIAEKAKILAIFGDQGIGDPKEEKAFRDGTGFTAPFLMDLSVEAGTLYDSTRCPRVWVIDPQGIVRYRSAGQTTPPAEIVAGVVKALGS